MQRDLNRELKLLFDKHNINIPFPQVVVNKPVEIKSKTTKKIIEGAREFVSEQKEQSQDLEDENE